MPSMKNENQILANSPSALKAFLIATRPKTWIASLSPVFIGTVMAAKVDGLVFFLTLLFSLFIQIGANYANDYFDFINGADTHLRNGPKRVTQQGWIRPHVMFNATMIIFSIALLIAIPLMIRAGLWSLFIAGICILFAILYTGGPKPLGYLGLGELLVFFFFGPLATCGSFFLQTLTLNSLVFIASLAPGLLSSAILIANNLRDEKTDKVAKKNTLIVRFGKKFGSIEYTLAILLAALVPIFLKIYTPLLSFIFAIPLIKKAFDFKDPLELIPLLQKTAFVLIVYTLLYVYAFAF